MPALPSLNPSVDHDDKEFRVPYVPVLVEKDTMTSVSKLVPITEVHVMANIFGENKVHMLEPNPEIHGARYHESTFRVEHNRLEGKYGINRDTGLSHCEEAYGPVARSMLSRFMGEHHTDAEAFEPYIETRSREQAIREHMPQPDPTLVPETNTDAVVERDENADILAELSLETRAKCIEYLTARGIVFSTRKRLASLQALALDVVEVEELGIEIPPGTDEDSIAGLKTQVTTAASGGIDDAQEVQSILDAAAGQSIPG